MIGRMLPAGKETKLSKIRCESYINEEQKQKWKDFDEMVSFMQSLHVVQVDFNSWQQSKCSCASWVKNLKCDHVISVCYRLYKSKKLSDQDFITAVMNLPIEPNRKRGRPALTTQAELRQPNEAQNEETDQIEYLEELRIAKKNKIDSTNTDRPSRICKKKTADQVCKKKTADRVCKKKVKNLQNNFLIFYLTNFSIF